MKKPHATFKAALALALVGGLIAFGFSDRAIPRLLMTGLMSSALFTLGAEIQKSGDFFLRDSFQPGIKGVLSHPWVLLGVSFATWKFFEILDRHYG